MNTQTGKAYEGEDVAKARDRGESLVTITARAWRRIVAGRLALARKLKGDRHKRKMAIVEATRAKRKKRNRVRDEIQHQSRKRNR